MKAVSFWALCRVTLLTYLDRMAKNVHRRVEAANTPNPAPAVSEGFRQKPAMVTAQVPRLRRGVKVSARKPLAGVGANADE